MAKSTKLFPYTVSEVFAVWQSSASVQEAADTLGIDKQLLCAKKAQFQKGLKEHGVEFKKMPRGGKKAEVDWAGVAGRMKALDVKKTANSISIKNKRKALQVSAAKAK